MVTIMLYVQEDIWVTDSTDPYRKELFGSSILPTTFPANTPAKKVYQEIKRLNPNARVITVESAPERGNNLFEHFPHLAKPPKDIPNSATAIACITSPSSSDPKAIKYVVLWLYYVSKDYTRNYRRVPHLVVTHYYNNWNRATHLVYGEPQVYSQTYSGRSLKSTLIEIEKYPSNQVIKSPLYRALLKEVL